MLNELLKTTDFDVLLLVFMIANCYLSLVLLFFVIRTLHKLVKKKTLKFHPLLLLLFVPYVGVAYIFISAYTQLNPTLVYTSPGVDQTWRSYREPIVVKFSHPVYISDLNPSINPKINGKWEWEKYLGIDNLTRQGKFYPEETTFPNQRVVVYITGARRALYGPENHESALNFASVELPNIASTDPVIDTQGVMIDTNLTVNFDKPNDGLLVWNVTATPVLEFTVEELGQNGLRIIPALNFSPNQSYSFKFERIPIRYSFTSQEILERSPALDSYEFKFTTGASANITSFSPQGSAILADTPIKVTFGEAPVKESVESAFTITPKAEGVFGWTDDLNMVFTPVEPLSKETLYTVTFPGEIERVNGTSVEISTKFKFETIGRVKVVSYSPANQSYGLYEAVDVSVTFNQDVDKNSAEQHFSISPAVAGSVRWPDNRTMIFSISNRYNFSTGYTVSINPGIQAVYGTESSEGYSFYFSIRAEEVLVPNVPFYYQPYGSFSCNIYAAKMALAWRGYSLSAGSIIAELGYNPNTYNGVWTGNPYSQFVGNADGSWGYGVYAPAVQRLFSARGIGTEIKSYWNVQGLAATLTRGYPVIIWRYNGESADYDKDWIASDGTYIHAINGQHGGVVIGFRGSVNSPYAFLINDPWYGQIWMDVGSFDYYWSRLGRTALVVY